MLEETESDIVTKYDLFAMSNQITGFVPYLHVQDVSASQAFYKLFGLEVASFHGPEEKPFWARMKAEGCDLMLANASGAIDEKVQAVLFYLYVPNLIAMREHLLTSGLEDSGVFSGEIGHDSPRNGKVFAIQTPFYMPEGELRVHDPDGYVLLIGQLG